MSLFISSVFTYDEDAGNYIQAVETADTQALEPATRKAINNFVIGCKQDGIWTAIKASCILAGARTLAGALQPLVGTAPTNVGGLFVSGDYTRKTGLVGDGSTKYLNSNRNNNADPQDSKHIAVYASAVSASGARPFIGTFGTAGNTSWLLTNSGSVFRARINDGSNTTPFDTLAAGFRAASRPGSSQLTMRLNGTSVTGSSTSGSASNESIDVYRASGVWLASTTRLAFYSIGESLDLARLDARVTDLINAFAVTIP